MRGTLLAQILRSSGQRLRADLQPVTDRSELIDALVGLLSLPTSPSSGHVVPFDLATVGVDLSAVPMDEIPAWAFATGDHLGGALAAGGALLGVGTLHENDVGAFSFLFRPKNHFRFDHL
ncbi:MAG TPA: hypothetical protein VE860_13140 [Chthoniobacterales bacterium]|nr:hypothetical protein [Chthoniobacterales bacterium]